MIFLGEPNMFVRPAPQHKNRIRPFRFDENGEYKTENPLLIKLMSSRFEIKKETEDVQETNEQELRQKAKEMGIKSWHIKKIENLIAEMSDK